MSPAKSNLGHHRDLPMISISDKKEMERSSPKLAGAIALSSFGPKSLEILKSITCNIKIKKQNLKLWEGKGVYLLACCNV